MRDPGNKVVEFSASCSEFRSGKNNRKERQKRFVSLNWDDSDQDQS